MLLLDLLAAEKFDDRVMVQSFDWRTLQLVQKRAPTIPTVYLTLQTGKSPTLFSTKPPNGPQASTPPSTAARCRAPSRTPAARSGRPASATSTPALVAESHGLGLKVVVWTVNKDDDITRLIDMGVDGIISDRPDLLREVAGKKGIALPKGFPVTP